MSEQQDRPESLLGSEPHTSGLEPERSRAETSVPTDSAGPRAPRNLPEAMIKALSLIHI